MKVLTSMPTPKPIWPRLVGSRDGIIKPCYDHLTVYLEPGVALNTKRADLNVLDLMSLNFNGRNLRMFVIS